MFVSFISYYFGNFSNNHKYDEFALGRNCSSMSLLLCFPVRTTVYLLTHSNLAAFDKLNTTHFVINFIHLLSTSSVTFDQLFQASGYSNEQAESWERQALLSESQSLKVGVVVARDLGLQRFLELRR